MGGAPGSWRSARSQCRTSTRRPENDHVGSGQAHAEPGGLGAQADRARHHLNRFTAPQTSSAARHLDPAAGTFRREHMKKLSVILLAGVLTSLLAGAAVAGTPRVDRREARLHQRIVEGR